MSYYAKWSEEDGEWVGLCERYPSLSHLAPTAGEALEGIYDLVRQIILADEIMHRPGNIAISKELAKR